MRIITEQKSEAKFISSGRGVTFVSLKQSLQKTVLFYGLSSYMANSD